jgi:hypothetical protein
MFYLYETSQFSQRLEGKEWKTTARQPVRLEVTNEKKDAEHIVPHVPTPHNPITRDVTMRVVLHQALRESDIRAFAEALSKTPGEVKQVRYNLNSPSLTSGMQPTQRRMPESRPYRPRPPYRPAAVPYGRSF